MKPREKILVHPKGCVGCGKGCLYGGATVNFPEAHFATFPPKLIKPCILAGCPPGGIVLDPFGGSGTTSMVAAQLKRDSIYIDLNNDYLQMALKRLGFVGDRLLDCNTYDVIGGDGV